jgi:hypothetical protein
VGQHSIENKVRDDKCTSLQTCQKEETAAETAAYQKLTKSWPKVNIFA